jgi:hypothetical protein
MRDGVLTCYVLAKTFIWDKDHAGLELSKIEMQRPDARFSIKDVVSVKPADKDPRLRLPALTTSLFKHTRRLDGQGSP